MDDVSYTHLYLEEITSTLNYLIFLVATSKLSYTTASEFSCVPRNEVYIFNVPTEEIKFCSLLHIFSHALRRSYLISVWSYLISIR